MTQTTLPAVVSTQGPKRSLLGYWIILFTIFLLLTAAGWELRNMRHQLKTDILKLDAKFSLSLQGQDQQLESLNETFGNIKQRINNNLNDHQSRLGDIEQRLQDHQNRLQSLTNRTLDDRLVAETLLLVKQANLRLVLERDVSGAQLLLSEAEQLLRNTANADLSLLAVRQILNRDLTALKLVAPLDKDGLYLQLSSLLDLIPQLALQPSFNTTTLATHSNDDSAPDEYSSWTDWLLHGLKKVQTELKHYIRLEDRTDLLKPILTQESAKLIQLNLRLLLEQAQLALLEQRSGVYQQSLQNADQLLTAYFWESAALGEYRHSLQQLAATDIAPSLPALTDSLQQLQTYQQQQQDKTTSGGATP